MNGHDKLHITCRAASILSGGGRYTHFGSRIHLKAAKFQACLSRGPACYRYLDSQLQSTRTITCSYSFIEQRPLCAGGRDSESDSSGA